MTTERETAVAVINHAKITIVTNGRGEQLVPIRPICNALGIDWATQWRRIQADEILSSTVAQWATVGADGKSREMVCLPMKFVPGRLFQIDLSRIAEEARPAMLRYRWECYNALFDYFTGQTGRLVEQYRAETELLQQISDMKTRIAEVAEQHRSMKSECRSLEARLMDLQRERIDGQQRLFN